MNLNTNELILTSLLNCGYADLDILDNCYSQLADEVIDMDNILAELVGDGSLNLNNILFEAYYQIANRIIDDAIELLTKEYSDEVAEDFEIDNNEIKEKIVAELTKMLNSNSPFCNCLDTHFSNHLDQTIDWGEDVWYNVQELIKYIKESVV